LFTSSKARQAWALEKSHSPCRKFRLAGRHQNTQLLRAVLHRRVFTMNRLAEPRKFAPASVDGNYFDVVASAPSSAVSSARRTTVQKPLAWWS